MKCVLCKQGQTHAGHLTVAPARGETTVVFKGVPADVCKECGEYDLDPSASERLLESASAPRGPSRGGRGHALGCLIGEIGVGEGGNEVPTAHRYV